MKVGRKNEMSIIDPRKSEEKHTWKKRGPNIVRRPGEVRALLWRMLPWYATAFFGVIAAGSMVYEFWFSATLALVFAALSPTPVRRWLRFDRWFPSYGPKRMAVAGILATVLLAIVCELAVINRIDEFNHRPEQILAQAEEAVEAGEYQAVYELAKHYDVLPSRPLKDVVLKAQKKQQEEQERLKEFTEVFLNEYRRHKQAQREAEARSNSAGE